MNSSPQLSPELGVVMPIYNEEASVSAVIREWFDCLRIVCPNFTLFAINDGSEDRTSSILALLAKELGPRLRILTKINSGHGMSCREGYELALENGAEWIFQTDSDGQCDPTFFETIYGQRSEHDCVFGYRRTRDDGCGRLAITRAYRLLLWFLTGTFMRDANVPYRLIRANALRSALQRVPADVDLQNIALTISLKRQAELRWKDVPIHFRARRGGENSINYHKIVKMGIRFLRDFHRITHEDSHTRWRPGWARRRLAS